MIEYEYMVVYHFKNSEGQGTGRCFVTRKRFICTQIDIESIEKAIKDQNSFEYVSIINFILLRDFKL